MTKTNMRKLDFWIAENVMGWKPDKNKYQWHTAEGKMTRWCLYPPPPAWAGCDNTYFMPSRRQDAAMEVLKKCAEKMFELYDDDRAIAIKFDGTRYSVTETDIFDGISEEAMELPLAICKFARLLFNKGN